METTTSSTSEFAPLEFDERYYVQTAKNSIESVGHVIAEVGTNEDEAISRRAERDKSEDKGFIRFAYDPIAMVLTVTGDGDGMTAATMEERLRNVGKQSNQDSKRGFFRRGVREVFLAMGGGKVESVGIDENGKEVFSVAEFNPSQGMALLESDEEPSEEIRTRLGLKSTGTRVTVPMRRFAEKKRRQFQFTRLESSIRDCVGLRPALVDPNRDVYFEFDQQPEKRLRFQYPDGQDLVKEHTVKIGGLEATCWAKIADDPIKGKMLGKQLRRSGILVRGDRAAYEVATGQKLSQVPAINRVFGEIRMDGIERLQREADERGDDNAPLVYKPDRSGLNLEHPLVEAIYTYLDDTIAPLIANLESGDKKRNVSPDMRRQLQKLARVINSAVIADDASEIEDPGGEPSADVEKPDAGGTPPTPPTTRQRDVLDGIAFAKSRIRIEAGKTRTVEVWIDSVKIPAGSRIEVESAADEVISSAQLTGNQVPEPASDGISQLDLVLRGGNTEGRHEVKVRSGEFCESLVVHVRFPRASGFISQIVPEDSDWESGSALWVPSSGVVTVYVGRPEFRDAERSANRAGEKEAWKYPPYRQLVVESVREAALWPAAQRKAEVEWDELPMEERQGDSAFHRLVQSFFQELDYELRSKLLEAFVQD